ncbi:MAG: hypothetical protein BWY53_00319 [Parcubacteria group bacterium ADurb.Bin326]|nr:MAG: hypothetical protein BWY53_00319 [Parcubacteria group bacterium ADurb.Bin326]
MAMQSTSYLYRPVLKRAWEITKKSPSLWVLGLLSIAFSVGSEYEIMLRALYNSSREGIINAFLEGVNTGISEGATLTSQSFWINSWNVFVNNIGSATTALFVFACIFVAILLFIWLAICSQVAMIRNIYLIDKGKKPTLAEGFNFSFINFWPILFSVISLKIALMLMFGLLGLVLWLVSGFGWAADVIYVVAFIAFVGASLVFAFLIKYQIFYILLKKQNFTSALKDAWSLFAKNWLVSLEMAGLMFLVFLVGVIVSAFLITIFFSIPIVIVPYYFGIWPVFLKFAVSLLSLIGIIATAVIVNSFVAVLQWSSWTLLFSRLEQGEASSGIERISATLKGLPQMITGKG